MSTQTYARDVVIRGNSRIVGGDSKMGYEWKRDPDRTIRVVVNLDLDAIARVLAEKCDRNKSGRARFMSGFIKGSVSK